MKFSNDIDCWLDVDPKDLWITDKMLLSKNLGYICGPAGLPVPYPDNWIVRPCVNYRMMSRGATIMWLEPDTEELVPDGFFWCELFEGRHLSFDYNWGQQCLAVEGFRNSSRLDRFCRWKKVDDVFFLPPMLQDIANRYMWFNIECIGSNIIECHFRNNDDFANHDSDEIFPIWKDGSKAPPHDGMIFYKSESSDRLGFWV